MKDTKKQRSGSSNKQAHHHRRSSCPTDNNRRLMMPQALQFALRQNQHNQQYLHGRETYYEQQQQHHHHNIMTSHEEDTAAATAAASSLKKNTKRTPLRIMCSLGNNNKCMSPIFPTQQPRSSTVSRQQVRILSTKSVVAAKFQRPEKRAFTSRSYALPMRPTRYPFHGELRSTCVNLDPFFQAEVSSPTLPPPPQQQQQQQQQPQPQPPATTSPPSRCPAPPPPLNTTNQVKDWILTTPKPRLLCDQELISPPPLNRFVGDDDNELQSSVAPPPTKLPTSLYLPDDF